MNQCKDSISQERRENKHLGCSGCRAEGSAISATGAQLAQEIMENELVMKTDAYRNGNLVILENPGIWYLAEGGITSLGIMLSDLEKALLD